MKMRMGEQGEIGEWRWGMKNGGRAKKGKDGRNQTRE